MSEINKYTGLNRDEEKEYNESYNGQDNSTIKKVLGSVGAIGLAAATVGAGYGIGEVYSDIRDKASIEEEASKKANTEYTIENAAGFPNDHIDHLTSEGESYWRIAEIKLAEANIKATPQLIQLVSNYMININNRANDNLDVNETIRIPAYLGERFKEINQTEKALPEASSPILLDEVPEEELSGIAGILVSPNITATILTKGESLEDVAASVPGYLELVGAFPQFAKQARDLIRSDNPGKFDSNGDVLKSGMAVTRQRFILNIPSLGEVVYGYDEQTN